MYLVGGFLMSLIIIICLACHFNGFILYDIAVHGCNIDGSNKNTRGIGVSLNFVNGISCVFDESGLL